MTFVNQSDRSKINVPFKYTMASKFSKLKAMVL